MEKETKIIGFVNQKGGAGKTTLTVLVANPLAINFDKKIAIIDADIQGSIIAKRKLEMEEGIADFPYPVYFSKPSKILETLEELDGEFDYIFIDMPGQAYGEGLDKLLISLDFAFVPCLAGDTDVNSTYDFLEILKQVKIIKKRELNSDIKIHLVNNKVDQTVRYKDMASFFDQVIESSNNLIEKRDPALSLKSRVSYPNLFSTYTSGYKVGDELFDSFISSFKEKI
ncbi:ParA family protein [Alistipes sp. ZOR0009]|uniref:ParA family protein n=1 Tax=Alistipes sp. ZOR0009 TaxID=1339253 RepID=UPI0006456F18|nr:ParA family protein [Alistipes sp. ZOR0009]